MILFSSHFFVTLCSRRILKSSFVNMDSNPLAQLGKVKSTFCISKARWAPSASFWEIVEAARRFTTVDSGSNLITKSLFPCLPCL